MGKKKIIKQLRAELDKLKAEQPLNKCLARDVIAAADEVVWLSDMMEENILSITRRGAVQPTTIETEREIINYLRIRKVYLTTELISVKLETQLIKEILE